MKKRVITLFTVCRANQEQNDKSCRPEIAAMNFEYITYSIPNSEGRKLIEDESQRNSEIVFPDKDVLDRCETFQYLGDEVDKIYNDKWKEVKS